MITFIASIQTGEVFKDSEEKSVGTWNCLFCPKTFMSVKQRNRHHKKHQKSMAQCNLCNEDMEENKLELHIRQNHEEVSCSICSTVLPSRVMLRQHKRNIHKRKEGTKIGRPVK